MNYTARALRLTPPRDGGQRRLAESSQAPARHSEQIDAHGNVAHLLTLDTPHRQIQIGVNGTVEVPEPPSSFPDEGPLSPLVHLAPTPLCTVDERIRALGAQRLAGPGLCASRSLPLPPGSTRRYAIGPA